MAGAALPTAAAAVVAVEAEEEVVGVVVSGLMLRA
jgi:hypothetical protein